MRFRLTDTGKQNSSALFACFCRSLSHLVVSYKYKCEAIYWENFVSWKTQNFNCQHLFIDKNTWRFLKAPCSRKTLLRVISEYYVSYFLQCYVCRNLSLSIHELYKTVIFKTGTIKLCQTLQFPKTYKNHAFKMKTNKK